VQDHDRDGVQAQTRRDLGAAFDQSWSRQLHDPEHGVLAGVYYLGRQIESQLQVPGGAQDPAGGRSP
ncbi:hypothetical protein C3L29_040295, partial [Pseudomonas sp. MWU12-2534b]